MSDDSREPAVRSPEDLGEQPDVMRAELIRLRRDIEQVQKEFDDTHAAQLVLANEQLVLAALQAESIAETAMHKLNELANVSQRDALTDTPNRALMLDRLQHAIAMAKRQQARIAVLFVDVDRFKHINDTLGHAAGDKVLQLVARRLEGAVRNSDTVSRHSGDEFLILLAQISQASDAALIASKMLAAVATSSPVGEESLRLSASVGIAIYPDDGEDAESLIARADAAMYRSKRMGGGGFQFHSAVAAAGIGNPQVELRAAPVASGVPVLVHDADAGHLRELRDVNEQLVLSSLALHGSEARAVQAHQQQVKFLAMVAHELRNPLAPIRTAAELLNRVRADDAQHARMQELIKRQVAHMARIVDDLLDGSRVNSGQFHLEPGTTDLVEILDLTVESCRSGMDAKLQQLRTQWPGGPLFVHGDPVRLAQVFRNLLDNACKYTPKGGSISLTAVVAPDTIVITVADNGIGIAAEALPQVFDLFVRDARAVPLHRGGLGIGLAVVRELVEAHGGSVVASSAGQHLGSEFVVTLPVATAHPGVASIRAVQ